jgi:acyl-CoA hydrolase
MDDLKVCAAPDIERDILLRARINYVGRSSMEVGIRVEQQGESPIRIASCYFTMVARLKKDGQELSVPLPSLQYPKAEDQRRADRALARRARLRAAASEVVPEPSEYALLHNLHKQREMASGPLLRPGELTTSGWERTYPEYENVPQTIFGGYVVHRAYMYAHICAEMLADQRALLVSSDRIDFYQPVRMGDKLHFTSRVTYTGRTSITVETAITRISRDRTMTALSNNCIFTFVNVDADLNLMPVTQMYPTSYSEDIRYLVGHRRRCDYLQQRKRTEGEAAASTR